MSRWKKSKDLYAEKWREKKQPEAEAELTSPENIVKKVPLTDGAGLEDTHESKPFSNEAGKSKCFSTKSVLLYLYETNWQTHSSG